MQARIPLVGSTINRGPDTQNTVSKDQYFENCFPEVVQNPITGQGKVFCIKRQGFDVTSFASAGYTGIPGSRQRSMMQGDQSIHPFLNGTTLALYDTNNTIVGATISNISGDVRISDTMILSSGVLINHTVLLATSSTDGMTRGYYMADGGSSWTQITDVDFPPNQLGTVTGTISGSTLTTTVSSTGTNLPVGAFITGAGIAAGTVITAVGTAALGVGTYTVYPPQTTGAGITIAAGYPIVGNAVHMDGYMFVMDRSGKIWNSDLNSLANWSATAFLDTSVYPDGGSGLVKMGSYILGMGTRSIERFVNGGAATGSPLTRVPNATIRIGVSRNSLCEAIYPVNDSVYFVGLGASSRKHGVYRLTESGVEQISTPAINKALSDFAQDNDGTTWGIAGVGMLYGMTHVFFYTGTNRCPVYCEDTKQWWWWSTPNSVTLCGVACTNQQMEWISTTNRNRYFCFPDIPIYQDNGSNYTMTIQTDNIDHGSSNYKAFSSAEIIGDTQSTSGNLGIAWSNDDFQNFNTPVNTDTSLARKIIRRLGIGRRRAWKITETVNRPFRAEALELQFDVLSK